MLRSAVRIRYERIDNGAIITGHGTAFGVDLSAWGHPGKRYMLSAAHNVLDDSKKAYGTLKIEINEGTRTYWSQCKVLLVDAELDLCLIESGDDLPALTDLAQTDVMPGDSVVHAGSPRGIPIALYDGVMRRPYHQGTVRSVVELPFDHGCSGGPLFSAKSGKAIGVAVAGIPKDGDLDHTKGLFVPVHAIECFLAPLCKTPVRGESAIAERTRRAPASISMVTQKPVEEPACVESAPAPIPAAPIKVAASKLPEPTSSKPRAEYKPTIATNSKSTQPAGEFLDPNPPAPEIPATYVIEDGDSLTRIARRYNVSMPSLIELNNIKDPNRILVGSRLRLK